MPADAQSGLRSVRDGSVRAGVRVLRLLRLLNMRPSWTLHALHQETGLAKATLSRLLSTLEQEGYARSELPAGTWRVAWRVRELDSGYTEGHRLADLARAPLVRLTRQIKWPLAIGLPESGMITVRFSTMPYSPLAVLNTTHGRRLGLTDTAMGRAYLAFSNEATRRLLIDHLLHSGSSSVRPAREVIEADLQKVREAGHAIRFPGGAKSTATLAVPICVKGEAIACLSMTTFGSSMTTPTVVEHLPILRDAARHLAQTFEADDRSGAF